MFIFVFISITLGGGSKKILLCFMSKSVLPMFSSKSLTVPSLIFRSLIHLEFIFVYGVRECSNFILFFIYKFIYIFLIFKFLAALGLRCHMWAFSGCGEWGLLSVAVHGLLVAVASLVMEHGL